jgi:hypothetical protein
LILLVILGKTAEIRSFHGDGAYVVTVKIMETVIGASLFAQKNAIY